MPKSNIGGNLPEPFHNLVARETEKYRKAWAADAYRDGRSPGLEVAPLALDWARDTDCTTLTDYGCGDGRAMEYFRREAGDWLHVLGVDLLGDELGAAGAVRAPLWALPATLPSTDFAFSADVFEHLPPAKVGESLDQIRDRTRVAGFFQVATVPDFTGPREVGESLHLTVLDAAWWAEQVGRRFTIRRLRNVADSVVRLWVEAP